MKRIKFISIMMALILMALPTVLYAGEIAENDYDEIIEESTDIETGSKDTDEYDDSEEKESYTVQDVLQQELEDLAELTAGEDYTEKEAVFLADSRQEAEDVAEQYGGTLIDYDYGVATLHFDKAIEKVITEAAKDDTKIDSIETAIEPNYIAEIDDYETDATIDSVDYSQYQWYKDKINASNIKTQSGNGVKVAVIDTGADLDHRDLENNIAGSICVIDGYSDTTGEDDHSHGTHVAGIIGADDDGDGITGIAPEADLYIIKAADSGGSLSSSSILKAVQQAIDYDVDVINMSFGTNGRSEAFEELINEAVQKGIVCVAAAGNKGISSKHYPAAFDNVIAVAASTASDGLADYSNYGDWVDLTAPGGSGTANSTSIYSDVLNNSLGKKNGTSQATPMVSATAALILGSGKISETGEERVNAVRNAILNTVNDITYSYGSNRITGGLNAEKALEYAGSSEDNGEQETDRNSELLTQKSINTGTKIFTITYTSTVSYDGRKHISSEKKETKNQAADLKITVSCDGEEIPTSNYKIKYKNNKNASTGSSSNEPYFVIILKGKNFTGNEKTVVKSERCVFTINPCDISSADLTYSSVKIMISGVVKIKSLKYINKGGKKISLRSSGKNAAYSVTSVSSSSIIITGTGNFTGKRELNFK